MRGSIVGSVNYPLAILGSRAVNARIQAAFFSTSFSTVFSIVLSTVSVFLGLWASFALIRKTAYFTKEFRINDTL